MLLIAGASTRAAAFSALRAGFSPHCIDRFADHDLSSVCPVEWVNHLNNFNQSSTFAACLPETPWLYTGPIENEPALVEAISAQRPLWGNDAETLHQVRDPLLVHTTLIEQGFDSPEVAFTATGLARDGSWLVKPLASGGGEGIVPLDDSWEGADLPRYFQKRIPGPSFSGIFVASREKSQLLGVTRQWTGRPGADFAYIGSLGPWPLATPILDSLRRLGEVLRASFGLRGLWGVDFILNERGLWPVEINPRYTASVEVLDLAYGHSFLIDHARAFDWKPPESASFRPLPSWRVVGKRVLFATRPFTAPSFLEDFAPAFDSSVFRSVADVPNPGTLIRTGEPILTVFAHGATLEECQSRLQDRIQEWERLLGQV